VLGQVCANSAVGAGDAGDATASRSKFFGAKFGQNQNLASPKTFDLLRLCVQTIAIYIDYSRFGDIHSFIFISCTVNSNF